MEQDLIAAKGFWGGRHEQAFFEIPVFNPLAQSNAGLISNSYKKHENIKKQAYDKQVRDIEHGILQPIGALSNWWYGSCCYSILQTVSFNDCCKKGPTLQQNVVLAEMFSQLCPPSIFYSVYKGRQRTDASPWPSHHWGFSGIWNFFGIVVCF